MARLTILIPSPGGGEQYEDTLVSVLQNRPRNCEILVIYPGAYGDPYELADEVSFVETRTGASLVELINTGFEQASGDVVHVLQCGVEVTDDWATAALARFEEPSLGSLAPLMECHSDSGSHFTAGVGYSAGGRRRVCRTRRSRNDHIRLPRILGPTLQAGFYRRDAVQKAGGFSVALGARYADIDMALTLHAAGYDAACEPGSRVHTRPEETAPHGFADARQAERLFWRHLPPEGRLGRVLLHAGVVVTDLLFPFPRPRGLLRFLGRLTGCLEGWRLKGPPATKRAGPSRPALASATGGARRRVPSPNQDLPGRPTRYVA